MIDELREQVNDILVFDLLIVDLFNELLIFLLDIVKLILGFLLLVFVVFESLLEESD